MHLVSRQNFSFFTSSDVVCIIVVRAVDSQSGPNILDTDGNTDKELQPLVLIKECSENVSEKLQTSKTEIAKY